MEVLGCGEGLERADWPNGRTKVAICRWAEWRDNLGSMGLWCVPHDGDLKRSHFWMRGDDMPLFLDIPKRKCVLIEANITRGIDSSRLWIKIKVGMLIQRVTYKHTHKRLGSKFMVSIRLEQEKT